MDLDSDEDGVREKAIKKLAGINPKAVSFLMKIAKDKDNEQREAAIEAIGFIGGKDAIQAAPILIEILGKDESRWVRIKAATALGNIADENGVKALAKAAVYDEEEVVRVDVRKALLLQKKTLKTLPDILFKDAFSKNEAAAARAIRALSELELESDEHKAKLEEAKKKLEASRHE